MNEDRVVMEHRLEIMFLEVNYVPAETGYLENGEIAYQRVPIGTHSIECKHMPQELRDQIVEFIKNVENAHDR